MNSVADGPTQKNTKLKAFWETIIGNPSKLVPENRMINAITIITLAVLVFMLIVNLSLPLPVVSIINISLLVITAIFFYLARFKKKYRLSTVLYGFTSYAALILIYRYNGGISGPTLFIFFLTFQLLVVITPRRQHLLWCVLHVLIGLGLTMLEKSFPAFVINSYGSEQARFLDIIFTYIIVLICLYFITNELRNSYIRERRLAELRLHSIEEQNRKLETLSRQKDKLFSIISHDMRSPLSTIQGYLELMSNTSLGEDEVHVKKELLSMTRHTSDMLLNMLTWQKTQMQGVEVKLSPVEVNSLIHEILKVQQSIAANKEIKIKFSTAYPITAMADPDMLRFAIRNVISNAIKFTNRRGSINIITYSFNGMCCIRIKDTGIGIPPDIQNQVFDLNAKTTYGTANEKGLGMGLPLCKEFIELQDGTIRFESKPNEGTEFIISLAALVK